ncbi:MAG: UDP-N-acetylmuramoyl-L-alanine--D-glutamate ligase [Pseudomonadota bacterium]
MTTFIGAAMPAQFTFPKEFHHYWIVGLGRSGTALALALDRAGHRVSIWDDDPTRRASSGSAALPALDPDSASQLSSPPDVLILSPGIPHYGPNCHKAASFARQHHLPILCDIALFVMAGIQARTIMVTGTNGKSTLASMITDCLNQAGITAIAGGNIGQAVFNLPELDANGIYVLELSSYQLERMGKVRPDFASLITLTPDHLDRHGTMERYLAAKSILFDRPLPSHPVIGIDSSASLSFYQKLVQRQSGAIAVSGCSLPEDGIGVQDNRLISHGHQLATLQEFPQLPGAHHALGLGCCWGIVSQLGVTIAQFRQAMRQFQPLAHRQRLIATIGHIRFIDDSKATNAESAIHALRAWPDCLWIVGGRPKEEDYTPLARMAQNHVRKAYLIGEAEQSLSQLFARHDINYLRCGTLEQAVGAAFQDAASIQQADILLSPAAASFDQFRNFEERGKAFAALVRNLRENSGISLKS